MRFGLASQESGILRSAGRLTAADEDEEDEAKAKNQAPDPPDEVNTVH